MLNAGTVKEIAKTSGTAHTVLEACSKRERFRERINLKKFKYDLIKAGYKVVDEEFLETFKQLEAAGVGSLIKGRNGNPDRFAWNFNLRDVGAAAFTPNDKIQLHEITKEPKRKRLTALPVRSIPTVKPETPKEVTKTTAPSVQIVINLSSTADKKDVEALIALAQELGK